MTLTNDITLQEGIDYALLNDARLAKNLTVDQTATLSNVPKETTKNILNGKTKNPGAENLGAICRTLGVPMEKVLRQDEQKQIEAQAIKEDDSSVLALKEIYEMQIATMKATSDEHIHNIRSHYEQHHEDLKENFERRLADKRELIESYKEHIATLEKDSRSHKIAFWLCAAVLICLLIAEVMNPNLGWFRF